MQKLLLLVAFIHFIADGTSQESSLSFQFGITFPDRDANIFPYKPLSSDNRKYTFLPGITYKYSPINHLALQTGLFFEERGWLENDWIIDPANGNTDIVKVDFYYSFLTIPLIVQGYFGNNIRIHIGTGLFNSIRLDGGTKVGKEEVVTLGPIVPDVEAPNWDISFALECGVSVKVSHKTRMVAEASYFRSFTPIGRYTDFETEIFHKGLKSLIGIERAF